MGQLIEKLMEEMGNTTVRFWTNPSVNLSTIISLLLSSAILLTLCRVPFFGLKLDFTKFLLPILSFVFQLFSCLAYLARGGYGNAKDEVPKFFRLLVMAWIISLILFLPNFIYNFARFIPGPLLAAALFSFLSVALLASFTARKDRRENPNTPIDLKNIFLWSMIILIINTFFFYFFVIDTRLTDWINDKQDILIGLFGESS